MSNNAYPELLSDLADRATAVMREAGIDDARAKEIGGKVAEAVRQHWGGQQVYIPIGAGFEITQRDEAMWREFNGHNHDDLVRKYHVSLQHVYRVIRRMREIAREKNQQHLF